MDCRLYALAGCFFLFVHTSDTQIDNRGQEFLLSFANNYINKHGPSVVITNESPNLNSSVVINIKGMDSIHITVEPKSFQRVNLSKEVIVTEERVSFPAVYITSDINITVVGINDAHANGVGGFLALPVHSLGTDYVAGTYSPWLGSQIVIAALEDRTRVLVRVAKPMSLTQSLVKEGMIIALYLNKFEALMIDGLEDLTGTVLYSNKNIAAFSGNRAVTRPWSRYVIDHTVEQLLPFKTWNKKFILVPYPQDEYSWNAFRAVVRNRTRLSIYTLKSLTNVTLQVGDYYEITLSADDTAYVVSDYPVSIFHYAQTKKRGSRGTDMSISNVPPIVQYVNEATFTTYDQIDEYDASNFLTITSRCDVMNETTVDNLPLNVFIKGDVTRTVNSEYCFAHLIIQNSGLHFVKGSGFLSVLHTFTVLSSYAFPIALGQKPMNCKTPLPDGRIYEHSCDQEVIPVQCQYEINLEEEKEDEECYKGYTSLQVFVIALFSAGGAVCIDLIIRCCKEANEPLSYADTSGKKKWTTSISELRQRRKAIRLRSLQDEFEQVKDQPPGAMKASFRCDTEEEHIPTVIEKVVPMSSIPGEFAQSLPPTLDEYFYSNSQFDNESAVINVKRSESDTISDISLAYNESKV
ncbi:uncharacterized protein LOC117115647 isoform X2 [Anneissia japonica]|uniref:uncharacterized protein LOC117115647 isoform X2 n=1 Tax=Anneissia japonica TaxID=1529436 RepID=UPI0014254C8D|nr:uncharacterized protein LOC117115647 isoform X2 [Anneissia japonica]